MVFNDQGRLLSILEHLFEISPTSVESVLNQCADLIARATRSEKVDVFLYEATSRTLIAIGTSRTELGHLQKSMGLDHLPLANADPMSQVFETGEPYHTGRADEDPRQPRGVIEGLGIRSMTAVALDVAHVRKGVLSVASRSVDAFTAEDLGLLKIVGVWIGSLVHRSELLEENARRAAEQGRRAVAEELITVVAHDLRNLLNPIALRLALVLERAQQAERKQDVDDCERANAGLTRVNVLLTELLDVARLEQGVLSLNCERLDLIELVAGVASALSLPATPVHVAAYVNQLPVFADRLHLTQAIENVVSNAIKHSPKGAPVAIQIARATHADRAAVKITIEDQGPGIAPELLPRIFDRYVSDRKSGGLGLGLYLARGVLAAHGGAIAISSEAAPGTRCELILPLTDAAPDPSS
jgi:two-component system OmpR family sensor kinase